MSIRELVTGLWMVKCDAKGCPRSKTYKANNFQDCVDQVKHDWVMRKIDGKFKNFCQPCYNDLKDKGEL